MASNVTIRVTSIGVTGEYIELRDTNPNIRLTFSEFKTGFGLVPLNKDVNIQAQNIANKFRGDFNGRNNSEVSVNGNVISISNFTNDYFSTLDNQSTSVTASQSNSAQEDVNDVTTAFGVAAMPCANVRLTVTASPNAPDSVEVVGLGTSTFSESTTNQLVSEFDVPRGINVGVRYTYGVDVEKFTLAVPSIFEIGNIVVTEATNGAIANISSTTPQDGAPNTVFQVVPAPNLPTIPPSIEANYVPTSIFTGLVPADYVVYARDGYGCERVEKFQVDGVSTYLTVPFYSKASPLNDFPFFLQPVSISDGENRSVDNYLVGTEPLKGRPKQSFTHKVYEGLSNKLQFQSSAIYNNAYWVDCDGNETELPLTKKSDFIDANSYLEGNIGFDVDLGKSTIFFTGGDEYDEDGNIIGSHGYNNTLPTFYEEGVIIFLPNYGQFVIEQLITATDGSRRAVINNTNSFFETGIIIESIHTEIPYEEYEIDYDVNTISADRFYIKIDCRNTFEEDSFNALNRNIWLTNWIEKISLEEVCNYHTVRYWSDARNEINYDYGIKHIRYVEWQNLPIPSGESEIETLVTDRDTIKIDYQSTRLYQFSFFPQPNEIAISLKEALDNSEYIVIDRKAYVSRTEAELRNIGVQQIEVKANLTASSRVINFEQFDGFTSDGFVPNSFYPVVD